MKVVNSYCSEKINENKNIPTIATTKTVGKCGISIYLRFT